MKLKTTSFAAIALAAFVLAGSANAAVVTYSYYTATSSTDTSWVSVTGYDYVVAGNAGGASTTFGGVAWGAMPANSLQTSANGVTINYSAPGKAWALVGSVFYSGGPSLLNDGGYTGSLQSGGVDFVITLTGLSVSQTYKVQFVMADTRGNNGYTTILEKDANLTGDSAATRYSYTDGRFAVITASFTADATTAYFQPGQRWDAGGGLTPDQTFVSGIQVLAIPEPSAAALGLLAAGGLLLRRRR